jgi:Trk K+ transport system NAD-binding subunit
VDRSYSPGRVAAKEILQLLDDSPLRLQATLATGIDAYLVRVDPDSEVVGKALRDVKLSPDWVVGAIRRADEVWAPSAEDVMRAADTALVIGRRGQEGALRRLFLNE